MTDKHATTTVTTTTTLEAAKSEAAQEREAAKARADERTTATNQILEAIAWVSTEVRTMRSDFGQRLDEHDLHIRSLQRTIHGSKPPPPVGGLPLAEMAARGSAAGYDVEELRGELLAVRSELSAQSEELAQQSSAMGLGKRGLAWAATPEGRRSVVGLITLAGAGFTAIHTLTERTVINIGWPAVGMLAVLCASLIMLVAIRSKPAPAPKKEEPS